MQTIPELVVSITSVPTTHLLIYFLDRYRRKCQELERELKVVTERANTYRDECNKLRELNVGLQQDILSFVKEHSGEKSLLSVTKLLYLHNMESNKISLFMLYIHI